MVGLRNRARDDAWVAAPARPREVVGAEADAERLRPASVQRVADVGEVGVLRRLREREAVVVVDDL
jgi:hypothetical protein